MTEAPLTSEQALDLVEHAQTMSPNELARIQETRLQKLLAHARHHSPFLAEKYKNLPEQPKLAEIPVLDRAEGVANFDGWMCDREVTSARLDSFLERPETALQDFLGRYRVLSTSGSTAAPLRIVRDSHHNAVNAALMRSRFWGSKKLESIPGLKQPWPRICAITAGGGRHSSYLSYLRMQREYEAQGLPQRAHFLPIDMPISHIIARLNAAQPEIVGSYPSIFQILARAQKEGELRIRPLVLCSSAEYLDPEARAMFEEIFQCPVMDNYCSTEGGELAQLCAANHLHLNTDWMLLEPVDASNNPVADGWSDGALLTNLANFVQPVIRYRISDRIRLRHEPCPCGSPFPVLEIEGRKEDILEFPGKTGPFLLSPPVLMVAALHINGCAACQFLQHSPEDLEIRCQPLENADHAAVLNALQKETARILKDNDVCSVRLTTSRKPLQRGKSGKLRVFVKDAAGA